MVSFFPHMYKDELLYSAIARYHIRSGNLDCKSTLRELFNKDSVTAGIELPANINLLVKNLPYGSMIKGEDIIRNNTLYSYFTAFTLEDKSKEVLNLMMMENGSNIFPSLGLSNKAIKLNSNLKYCPKCVQEDRRKYGETYWHRIHQAPGVILCDIHDEFLVDSNIAVRLKNRQEYISAELAIGDILSKNKLPFKNIDKIIELQRGLHENIRYIFKNQFRAKDINYFREIYFENLIKNDLAKSRMLIYQDELCSKFKNYYGEEYLNALQCNFDGSSKYNWVSTMSRKHRGGFHTLQHLLFIQCLDINIKEVFEKEESVVRNETTYKIKDINETEARRSEWLELIRSNPSMSKTELRSLSRSIYTYLHKYDNQWLKINSPKKRLGELKEQRVDWQKRDKELNELIVKAIEELKRTDIKPERVTLGLIGKKIGKLTILQRNIDKLPITKRTIEDNVETVEEYQIRRIKWAIDELKKEGDVREWKVVRKAGVTPERYWELRNNIISY